MRKKFKLLLSLFLLVLLSFTLLLYLKVGNENKKQITTWGYNLVLGEKKFYSKESLKIAILDSGINKEHEDLKKIKFHEYNILEKDKKIKDTYGHGTAIAGIIAAIDNKIGVKGILENIELYDVKVLNDEGIGNVNDLIEAIDWCIKNNIDIINISFGLQKDDERLKQTIDRALKENIIIVASIGNNFGMPGDYPARYEGVYAITSINEKLERSKFAAKGNIDFAMPGENIYSTDKVGGYDYFSGTSFATAFATGVISWLFLEYKHGSPTLKSELSFDEYLKKHVFFKDDWNFNEYGYGILNLRGNNFKDFFE